MAHYDEHDPIHHEIGHHAVAPVMAPRVYPTAADRLIQAVWWLTGVVDTLLAIRFFLKLFGANPVPFVRFVYDLSWPFIVPFHGIFNTDQVGQAVLEPECLVAIAIYTLLAWGVVSLIELIRRPPATVVD